jgi:hypothetical protein
LFAHNKALFSHCHEAPLRGSKRPSEALASSSSAASAGANGCRSSDVGGFLRMVLVENMLIMSKECEKCDIPELQRLVHGHLRVEKQLQTLLDLHTLRFNV